MKKIIYLLLLTFVFYSCKKELKQDIPFSVSTDDKNRLKTFFAKSLAIALDKEPSLRAFIKKESLKQIDNDYDVIFQLVKNEKLDNSLSVYQTIAKHAASQEELDRAISTFPTLTIFVPKVPNFNAEAWDVDIEIPLVAVPLKHENEEVFLYNSNGDVEKVPFGAVPGVPVVVLKENKKIVTSKNVRPNSSLLVSNNDVKLYFADQAFNGMLKQALNSTGTETFTSGSKNNGKIARYVDLPLDLTPQAPLNSNRIDNACIEAFNLNMDWDRDYIYYGLNPANGVNKGKFNNDYVEHIVAIKFADNAYEKISEHPSDPKAKSYWVSQRPRVYWSDGNYDIRIAILINAKNGGGSQLEKIFSIKPSDLFDLEYTHRGNTIYYDVSRVVPKTCYLNEQIVAWDLENYGSQWKFIVREFDPTTETILTYTNSTQFATNFGFDASFGETAKFGIKFGATQTTTSSSSFQVKTTTGSNDLGEGILEFSSPIILYKETYSYTPPRNGTPYNKERYVTNDVSTGSVFISVEPKKIKNF